jgi:fatty-acyl-CoA synthase
MIEIATLADKQAVENGSGQSERWTARTLYQQLSETAAAHGARPAVSFQLQAAPKEKAVTLSWSALQQEVTQAANLLRRLGIGDGDTVAYVLPNCIEAVVTLLAGATAGRVAPINPLLAPEIVADLLRETGARVVVTLAPFPKTDLAEKVARAVKLAGTVEHVVEVDLLRYVGGPTRWLIPMIRPKRETKHDARIHDWGRAVGRGAGGAAGLRRGLAGAVRRLLPHRRDDGPAQDRAASGRGRPLQRLPRQALHVHRGGRADLPAADVPRLRGLSGLHVLPRDGRPFRDGHAPGLPGGGCLQELLEARRALARHLHDHGPDGRVDADAAPGGRRRLVAAPRRLGLGADAGELFHRFEEATGVKVLEGYGLTEATCLVSINPPFGERKIGSVGFPFPYTDVKIAECDNEGRILRECGPEEIGEICVRSPGTTPGETYTEPHRNRGLFTEDGYLRTGDLGRIDGDGYVWITGRAKDIIIRGGHNIDPGLIEDALMKHPDVAFVGAIGEPNAHAGEVPAVYVELCDGCTTDAEDLLDFARANVSEPAAVPKHVEVLPELPKTAVGKIFKPDLRRLAIVRVYDDALEKAGLDVRVVQVVEDKRRGLVAMLEAGDGAADEAAVASALGSFVTPWEWRKRPG